MFVLPLASVAVLTTVVVPLAKLEPLAGTLVTVTPGQLSVAITLNVTLLVHCPGAVLAMMFAGQLIAGFCSSFTVTVNVHKLELPLASVAMLVTVVTPTGNAKPLGGMLARFVKRQLSVAVTTKVTLLVQKSGAAFTTWFAGQLICGGSRSWIVTTFAQVPRQPFASATCSVKVKVADVPALRATAD